MRYLLLAVLGAALAGCMDLAAVVQQLKDDPASVCLNITHPYGNVQLARTAIVNGDVSCASGNLTVKSQASQVGVPLTVIPSVTLGQPTVTVTNPPR